MTAASPPERAERQPHQALSALAQVPAGRIDFHHHFVAPAQLAAQRAAMTALAPGFTHALEWTPEASLTAMDRCGIGLAVMTLAIPHLTGLPVADAVALSRECNAFGADLGRRHPGRMLALAALPMPDVDAACAEAARTVGPDGTPGVGLLTNYDDVWLGDPRYDPLYATLDERDAIVYVHPIVAACCTGIMPEFPPAMMEFLFDTARCIASLAYHRVFDRFPRLRWVFSHGSGAFPMVESRAQGWAARAAQRAQGAPGGGQPLTRVQERDNVFVDTASATTPAAFAAVRAMFRPAQVLFGTDFPYADIDATTAEVTALDLPPADRSAVDRDNALRLLDPARRA